MQTADKTTDRPKSAVREYAESIVIAIVLALVIRTFVVQAFKIPSGSMEDTLLIGDHILVNKLSYGIQVPFVDGKIRLFGLMDDPERGDIIVFPFPRDPSRDFIKRVIGLPGDQIGTRHGQTADRQDSRAFRWGRRSCDSRWPSRGQKGGPRSS